MYFGPRRMGKTEAMLNRAADKITECCFPGTRVDVCIVGLFLEQSMTHLFPRLRDKLSQKRIYLEVYGQRPGERAFLARTKDSNESYPCAKVVFLGAEQQQVQSMCDKRQRDGVSRQYFFDHNVLEMGYQDMLGQWLEDIHACGFKIVPVSKEAETASQFALRELETLRELSANSNLFKQEYEGKWQLPPWENAEKKDNDENNDPSKNTD